MKAGWETKSLADVAELQGRIGWKGLTAKEYTPEGPYFLSVHSLNYGDYVDFRDAFHISQLRYDESPEIMLRRDDLLICKDGAGIGKVGIIGNMPGPSTINSSMLLIRPRQNIMPKYLYFVLQSPYFQRIVQSRLEGATTPHLYQRDIATFPVHLPPLEEQRRIVAVLDEAFAAIAQATANAEKNLANARELFEAAFQDRFDHVGNGWNSYRLPEISANLDFKRKPVKKSDRIAGNVPYYGASGQVDSVRNHLFDDDLLLISEDGANLLMRTYPIAFSISGKSWVNNHAHILKFEDMATQRLVEYFFNSISVEPWVTGMAQPKLNQKALNDIPVPLPPVTERERLVGELDELADHIERMENAQEARLVALAALKQSLLHRAFTGELATAPELALA